MAQYKIAVIPGDGIGPEVIDSAVQILKAVSNDLGFSAKEFQKNTNRGSSRLSDKEII